MQMVRNITVVKDTQETADVVHLLHYLLLDLQFAAKNVNVTVIRTC